MALCLTTNITQLVNTNMLRVRADRSEPPGIYEQISVQKSTYIDTLYLRIESTIALISTYFNLQIKESAVAGRRNLGTAHLVSTSTCSFFRDLPPDRTCLNPKWRSSSCATCCRRSRRTCNPTRVGNLCLSILSMLMSEAKASSSSWPSQPPASGAVDVPRHRLRRGK